MNGFRQDNIGGFFDKDSFPGFPANRLQLAAMNAAMQTGGCSRQRRKKTGFTRVWRRAA